MKNTPATKDETFKIMRRTTGKPQSHVVVEQVTSEAGGTDKHAGNQMHDGQEVAKDSQSELRQEQKKCPSSSMLQSNLNGIWKGWP